MLAIIGYPVRKRQYLKNNISVDTISKKLSKTLVMTTKQFNDWSSSMVHPRKITICFESLLMPIVCGRRVTHLLWKENSPSLWSSPCYSWRHFASLVLQHVFHISQYVVQVEKSRHTRPSPLPNFDFQGAISLPTWLEKPSARAIIGTKTISSCLYR